MILFRVARFVFATVAMFLSACSGTPQIADQPEVICGAAIGLSPGKDLWQPDSPGFGYACLPSTTSVGPRGGPYDTYTQISVRVVGHSHTHVDKVELIVDLANPATAQAALNALSARVDQFFSLIHAPVPAGLTQAIRSHHEIAFETSFGPGAVFVREGSVPRLLVQIVRRGWRPDPGV